MEDFESYICLVQRFFTINLSNSDYSMSNREYTFDNLGSVLRISLMA